MKTKRPFVLATFLLVAFAACSSPSPTENGVSPNAPRLDNGGGFGSGTRSDSTTEVGGGFGSGT